jgi:hypothetical protein
MEIHYAFLKVNLIRNKEIILIIEEPISAD